MRTAPFLLAVAYVSCVHYVACVALAGNATDQQCGHRLGERNEDIRNVACAQMTSGGDRIHTRSTSALEASEQRIQ